MVEFAEDIGRPLDPWQRWLVIHAGELLPDGRPRFRKVLVLVARQNGKTELLVVLSLFWLWVDRVAMVLGTSTKLDYAAESWRKACRIARRVPWLNAEIPARGGIRKANGEQELWRADAAECAAEEGSRYKIAASNEEGGRSLTVDRAILDELRQHKDYSAWDAIVPAGNAVLDFQAWAISNAGGADSVVLNDLRDAALVFMAGGDGDPRMGLFEWSADLDAVPTDPEAIAAANPNLGHRLDVDALLGDAAAAAAAGGKKLIGFKTEVLCQRVALLDPAVDPFRWAACADPGTLDEQRRRLAGCLDVSLDERHATFAVAGVLPDGRARVEVVRAWDGLDCLAEVRAELAGEVAKVKPRVFGWFPNGPAAALAADLVTNRAAGWPPPGVRVDEITSDTAAVCMGFAVLVKGAGLAHSNDDLLTDHVKGAQRLASGDRWRFTRRGGGHCDAAYAAAGAVHLARTLPSVGRQRLVTAGGARGGSA